MKRFDTHSLLIHVFSQLAYIYFHSLFTCQPVYISHHINIDMRKRASSLQLARKHWYAWTQFAWKHLYVLSRKLWYTSWNIIMHWVLLPIFVVFNTWYERLNHESMKCALFICHSVDSTIANVFLKAPPFIFSITLYEHACKPTIFRSFPGPCVCTQVSTMFSVWS